MKDKEILKGIKEFFDIKELVGRRTYRKYRERSWKFLDLRLLHTLLILRRELGVPITCNTWYKGGRFGQRGLRTTVQQIVIDFFRINKLYLSAHLLGKGVDIDVEGMTAAEVRYWIIDNKHLFPYKIRLEHKKHGQPIPWVHLDVIYEEHNPKVYLFDVN